MGGEPSLSQTPLLPVDIPERGHMGNIIKQTSKRVEGRSTLECIKRIAKPSHGKRSCSNNSTRVSMGGGLRQAMTFVKKCLNTCTP